MFYGSSPKLPIVFQIKNWWKEGNYPHLYTQNTNMKLSAHTYPPRLRQELNPELLQSQHTRRLYPSRNFPLQGILSAVSASGPVVSSTKVLSFCVWIPVFLVSSLRPLSRLVARACSSLKLHTLHLTLTENPDFESFMLKWEIIPALYVLLWVRDQGWVLVFSEALCSPPFPSSTSS